MISFIRGELVNKEIEKAIVDVQGVGYGIFMSIHAMNQLPSLGDEVKIHTYLNIREDSMQLFGFLTKDDLNIFKLLIGVSGIGPKGGLSILSQLSPDDLRFAVLSGDAKAISKAPGIGKKTAEKLIIELKDKLDIKGVLIKDSSGDGMNTFNEVTTVQSEAVQALMALGYSSKDSLNSVKTVQVDETTTIEDVLKQALRNMVF